jgi:MIP family channel proteins
MQRITRRLVAECLGTFMLVFFGAGAVLAANFPKGAFGPLGVAFAYGLAAAVAVSATMGISGGHLNPAVTAGMLAIRRIDAKTGGLYIVAQILGGVLGAWVLSVLIPSGVWKVLSLGAPSITATITLNQAIAIEALLTFVLMSAYLGTVVSAEAPRVAGFGVGVALVVASIVGGPLTGAALNPVRAFGPAVISGVWISQAVYWIGPIIGAVVAAVLWEKVLFPKATD